MDKNIKKIFRFILFLKQVNLVVVPIKNVQHKKKFFNVIAQIFLLIC